MSNNNALCVIIMVKPLDYYGGMAKVPGELGWGLELDEKALQKYATDETIVIKI